MAHRIIIGVDYGTTFTGLSFVTSTKSSIDDIHVIRNWPGPVKDADEAWKTPSRIAYASENNLRGANPWGYLVTPKMKSYSWTKLLLDKDASLTAYDDPALDKYHNQAGLLQLPNLKSAPDVVNDYLYEIYKFLLAELERRLSAEVVKITPFEFWFTVPAIWSDKAKADTLEAARKAGFGSRPFDRICMIAEPLAAATATLKSLTRDGYNANVQSGDGILICDCGGGTVDITTYLIRQTHPNLEFEELVVGGGGKCGSTAIDRKFLAWMSRTFGRPFDSLSYENIGPGSRFMKEFESYKRDFGSADIATEEYEMPLVIPGVRTSKNYDQEESMVKIFKSDMISFFEPVVANIIGLLEEQIHLANKEMKQGSKGINHVVLVGGFGDSRHLHDELRVWCKENGNIRLLCPVNPQAAIVKGASLRGLENIEPIRTRCRRHYGFSISSPFRDGLDSESDAYICEWDGEKYCRHRMEWPITKGEYVDNNTFISTRLYFPSTMKHSSTCTVSLYSCSFESKPERVSDIGVDLVGEIDCNFQYINLENFESKFIRGKETWNVEFTVEVRMGSKEGILSFECKSNGKSVGTAHIEYARS